MTICRFYLHGRCRYGEKCWNEHTDPSPQLQRRENYTWVSPSLSSRGNYSNQYRDPGPKYNYNYESEYDSRSSTPTRNQYSDQYRWNNNTPSGYYDRSSAPKKNTTFQVQSSNRFEALAKGSDSGRNDKDSNVISVIRNDIIEWEEAHTWPFSCFSHFNDRGACLSGFVDISPEELRYRAYEAENSGSFTLYTEAIAGAMEAVRKKWHVLKTPTSDILQSIKSYHGTPDFCEENLRKLIPETGIGSSGGEQIRSGLFSSGQASTASSGGFSFKSAHGDSSGSLGSSSAFKSVLPASNQTGSSFPAFGSSSGFGSTVSSGFGSTASSGFSTATSSGFGSTASSGFGSTASSGFGSTAASGFGSTASSGFGSTASSGFGSTASSGFGTSAPSVFSKSATSSESSLFGSSDKESGNANTKIAGGSDIKSCAYTLLESLTENEKAQFSSQTFTLGKIPSRPPPIELCF